MNIRPVNFNNLSQLSYGGRKYSPPVFETVSFVDYKPHKIPKYYEDYGPRDFKKSDLKKIKKRIDKASTQRKDDSGRCFLKRSYLGKFYDAPLSFAIDTVNTGKRGQNTHIIEEVPEMFEGLDMNKVCDTLDIADIFLHGDSKKVKTNIDGREFEFEWHNCGAYGDVYKLKSEGYPTLAFKIYKFPRYVDIHGPFGEIAFEREASKAGVIDVPKFYMASPLGRQLKVEGDMDMEPISCASWKISEFIDEDTPKREGDLTLKKYLKKKHLSHGDTHEDNYVGGYCVDLGGVVNHFYKRFYYRNSYHCSDFLLKMIDNPDINSEMVLQMQKKKKHSY